MALTHRFERLPTEPPRADAEPSNEASLELIDARYRLRTRLGAGAMGVVYRAEDIWLARQVAVKVIREARATNDLFVDMFRTEARALAQIRHEHVVQVYAFGPHPPSFYLAMEYVDGEDLATILRRSQSTRQAIATEQAVAIIRQVGAGLEAVHARGLIHQDVKPSNIIVERTTGRPVLVDFGLARGAVTVVPATLAVGTPEYMAPEQCRASGVSAQTDVYALACTAFELLAGRPPFEGDAASVMTAHVLRDAPRLSEWRPDLAALDEVFARGLAKAPSDRHATALSFVQDLEAAVKRPHHHVRREVSHERIAQTVMRVLVLERNEQLLRQVVRIVDRALRATGDAIEIECVASAVELTATAESSAPNILIIDDESADGAVAELLAIMRIDQRTEVLVLRESFDALTMPPFPVRELPKPVNALVLASVLAQMARRIVARRDPPIAREAG